MIVGLGLLAWQTASQGGSTFRPDWPFAQVEVHLVTSTVGGAQTFASVPGQAT
jgi:hypothetical protein